MKPNNILYMDDAIEKKQPRALNLEDSPQARAQESVDERHKTDVGKLWEEIKMLFTNELSKGQSAFRHRKPLWGDRRQKRSIELFRAYEITHTEFMCTPLHDSGDSVLSQIATKPYYFHRRDHLKDGRLWETCGIFFTREKFLDRGGVLLKEEL